MRKNGLMIAGMIIILSAAGLLSLASLVGQSTARILNHSIDAAESYLAVKIALSCFWVFSLLALLWAFINKKAIVIIGLVLSAFSSFVSFAMLETRISATADLVHSLREVDVIWITLMFIACIALLVGTILKLVGIIKMNRQLSEYYSFDE